MSNVPTITTDDLRRQLAAGAVTEFWNVLTDQYYKGEMIPGSRRVPADHVGHEARRAGLARDAAIVVYCAGPHCPLGGIAATKLAALGFTNVREYHGGIVEWKEAGLPIERPEDAAVHA
jgi:rhodanese-related sulfurtransferase